ncbi:pyridoxal-phosphate-dependent aminotransferase family protein [Palleronia caenipelagi]|uniref:Alanine--glyoxylate aminotransferase family protein n=1 Tax=Palleronia caenipelagi TaxID=2489174 RepID=A0A547PY90_9RHOB|nr:aminotransferase class V-fold PLP-dependent enzyme [Palleronia caenipelagi]TRD19018.1 alanine--glyoxylate aminotransferase family protein [Palleronia caenipelagi]
MSKSFGRGYLAIPGPSVLPDPVLQAMMQPVPNIYDPALEAMTDTIRRDLKQVARTVAPVAIYITNGHGLWEAALANVTRPGDKVLVPANGIFAHGWAEVATRMGLEVELIEFGKQSAFDTDRIMAALEADPDHRIRAVLGVFVDTSTGIRNDLGALGQAMRASDHPALLIADCIASLGCDRFEMDAWGVDITLAASQKGLMSPPGVGFLWVNARAQAVREGQEQVSPYWDWRQRLNPEWFYQLFFGTAPTQHLFALRAALDLLMAEGIEAVWTRHARLARAIWAACERWSEGGPLKLNAPQGHRSHAVTALGVGGDGGDRLRAWCEGQGVTLGIGLGMAPLGSPEAAGFFRIGHMGHVNGHMVLGALSVIEAGLTACEIPHGVGALEAATRVIAGR